MSTRRSSWPPTRSTAKSCTALSNLACADGDRSATSSRNNVPRSAASNLPRRARTPVAIRSSMPNNSASTKVSTSAAQLTATNGPRRRALSSCTCRATSSLPDPVSPSISTVKSVAATRSICPRRCCMQALDPMSGDGPSAPRPWFPATTSRGESSISPTTRAASHSPLPIPPVQSARWIEIHFEMQPGSRRRRDRKPKPPAALAILFRDGRGRSVRQPGRPDRHERAQGRIEAGRRIQTVSRGRSPGTRATQERQRTAVGARGVDRAAVMMVVVSSSS